MMKKITEVLALALLLSGLMAFSAQANNPTLVFNIAPPTPGTIQYFAGSVLNGTGIQVDSITAMDTSNNGTFPLSNATLDFETGTFSGTNPGELDFNTGNGFVHIHGGLPAASIADGTFLVDSGIPGLTTPAGPLVALGAGNLGGTVEINFLDTKDAGLLTFFGLTNFVALGGSVNLSFNTSSPIDPTGATGFTSSTVLSGDVHNVFVPVPPSLALLGSGLLGLVGFRLRKNQA